METVNKLFGMIILLVMVCYSLTVTGQSYNLELTTSEIKTDPIIFTSSQYSKSIVLRNYFIEPQRNSKISKDQEYKSFQNYLEEDKSVFVGRNISLENLNSELKSVKIPNRCLIVFRRKK